MGAALENAKEEKQAHGEIETFHPGFLLGQDTYLQVPETDTRYISIAESLLEAGAKLLPHMPTMGNEAMSDFLQTYSG